MQQIQTQEIIETIITAELKGLCLTCSHVNDCFYRKQSAKTIIQCEMFEVQNEVAEPVLVPQGLCTTCDHALYCQLPGRKAGVWRCNEFT